MDIKLLSNEIHKLKNINIKDFIILEFYIYKDKEKK